MFAHFHLVQAIAFRRYSGSLETINALLGCPLVLPKTFHNHLAFFASNSKLCVDTYLNAINWFRECINAFVTCPEPLIRRKVLNRLSQLIELQRKYKAIQDISVGTKKPLTQLNTTAGHVTQFTAAATERHDTFFNSGLFRDVGFRQLSQDIVLLMHEDFEIKYPVPENEVCLKLHLEELW